MFIEQMHERFQCEDKYSRPDFKTDSAHGDEQHQDRDYETSDSSSLTDEGIAEQMFKPTPPPAQTIKSKSIVIKDD